MQIVDDRTGARACQAMVPMRDGTRLNTFVFLPGERRAALAGHPAPHALRHHLVRRARQSRLHQGWLPSAEEPMRGSILRGWRSIVAHGYAAVYQDTRGRHGSEGEDRVYADDAAEGYDTLDVDRRPALDEPAWSACPARRPAPRRPSPPPRPATPALRAFFAQAGGSSIYDDVVYEGQSIEMERLWLWVARNIPGLSPSHREAVMRRFGVERRATGCGGRRRLRRAMRGSKRAPHRPALHRFR